MENLFFSIFFIPNLLSACSSFRASATSSRPSSLSLSHARTLTPAQPSSSPHLSLPRSSFSLSLTGGTHWHLLPLAIAQHRAWTWHTPNRFHLTPPPRPCGSRGCEAPSNTLISRLHLFLSLHLNAAIITSIRCAIYGLRASPSYPPASLRSSLLGKRNTTAATTPLCFTAQTPKFLWVAKLELHGPQSIHSVSPRAMSIPQRTRW